MKKSRAPWLVCGLLAAFVPIGYAVICQSQVKADALPTVVQVTKTANGFELLRGGKPYFIKGAGGDASKPALKEAGGNSWRTWGVGSDTQGQLDQAQKLGMTVTVGIWLGHTDNGFNYNDAAQVAAQKEAARQAILQYRSSPALVCWAFGNEMETGGNEDNVAMWNAIEDIAKMAHQLDPNHPTMTVVAEIGGDKVKEINTLCPDIDIVGLNTYAGGPSIGDRYKAAGGVKPYIVTEYGPPGVWENQKNAWGVVPELTSTEKAARYKDTYVKSVLNQPLCLGSYAFTWGHKQEATATWFGLVLPDGSKLGAVDTLTELWSGHPPADLCPIIHSIAVQGDAQVAPGAAVKTALAVTDPQNHPLSVQWVLQADPATYATGGGRESTPPTYPEAIVSGTLTSATVRMPSEAGAYRLYAYVRDTHGSAAVANVSLDVPDTAAAAPVKTPTAKPVSTAPKATLPLVIYAEDGGDQPYIPSGYMGTTTAIKMDPACTVQPHSGKTCLKVDYTAGDNWGGVVWQSPANDWGDKPGGFNLTGAKTLTFWARGDQGGESVSFLFGLFGKDKTYADSGTAKTQAILSKDWKQYTISLAGLDLSQVKTGFAWTLAAPGHPVTFYLDDIKYQ
ncbi:MAG: hypothetical protein ACRYFS_17865 [Janthinobacterium lividum]